ncbi:AraC-like transcriptional regulator QhpR [Altericroceibacterium xinjiangense]|uniref:AraC-like transcriptional regulator QhpR n=1 Tax=Altericroceibacterium xinjiangense TaxID=762261 RepID=UPI000F7F1D33|nr:AraC family transcriptional regulator [Altericroceibacterium xinjiangense]
MNEVSVRGTALDGWRSKLRECGYAIDRLEALKAVPPRALRGPSPIPLREFVSFSERLVCETRDVAIPWLVGQHYDIASLGAVGDAIKASTKVGLALKRFVEYFELLQDCTDIRLDCDEQNASISYRILDPEIWPRHHDAMFSLGILGQIIRAGSSDGWDQVEFHFEASQADMAGNIDRVVGAPCSFGAEFNMLRFPTRLLDCRLQPKFAEAPIRELSRAVAQRNRSTPLAERLARVVYRDLDRLSIDQERVAREVGMSGRTMRRKLASEGSSFQQVLDECRMRQAVFEFQTKPDLSISQIALRLGYSEHSTFTRAFHRWSGISPQEFRKRFAQKIN